MSDIQEALKNTLVMLDALTVEFGITGLEPLIAEVKAALSEIDKCYGGTTPVSEPVYVEPSFLVTVWRDENGNYCRKQEFLDIPEQDGLHYYYKKPIPLHTSPQPREWVDLSDLDIADAYYKAMNQTIRQSDKFGVSKVAKAIEAKLKQLNTKG